jgi:predicted metalloprotease with PDZ domain
VFLLIPSARGERQELQIVPPRGWRIAAALEPAPAGRAPVRFQAGDYDELVDAPIELGRFARLRLEHGGRPIELVLHDGEGRPIPEKLGSHLRAILSRHERWFGPPPYRRYLIVVHTQGGQDYRALEHASGTSMVVPRSVLSDAQDYADLLYVIAHEHLHVWNGKRLRPVEHLPYDYLRPRPTRLLWWTEGVTDYLARRSLLAAGVLGAPAYLAVLGHEIGRVQGAPDRLRRSLADLSFEAFWPPRDPSEPVLSYYAKGHVVALLLDLELRARSGGRHGLEHVLRALLAPRGSVIPLGRAEIEAALRVAAGADLSPFLARWVDRPGELDYRPALARLGLGLRTRRLSARADPGFAARLEGQELEVTAVARGGPAARAGLCVGDRVLEIDGRRPHGAWRALLDPGLHELASSRRGSPIRRQLKLGLTRPLVHDLTPTAGVPASVRALRERWLAP